MTLGNKLDDIRFELDEARQQVRVSTNLAGITEMFVLPMPTYSVSC